MPTAQANGLTIAYETYGDPADPTLLMVMGLGASLAQWPPRLLEQLADRGLRVVAFDNRDVGQSSYLDQATTVPAYTLDDMAADAVGLLDALGSPSAHLLGMSLGGMIAQLVAIHWPERVRSLCSLMSSTSGPGLPPPDPAATAAFMAPPPASREDFARIAVDAVRAVGTPGFPHEEEELRERARIAYDRGYNPAGVMRQVMAGVAASDRTAALAAVRVPTVVIHGGRDPMIRLAGGEATARAIPGAELLVISEMGHDLPEVYWPQIVDAILANVGRAS